MLGNVKVFLVVTMMGEGGWTLLAFSGWGPGMLDGMHRAIPHK